MASRIVELKFALDKIAKLAQDRIDGDGTKELRRILFAVDAVTKAALNGSIGVVYDISETAPSNLFDRINTVIPTANYAMDNEGQLLIYTGLYSQNSSNRAWADRTWHPRD